ncbi:hypothetical protein BDW22DRAFT_1361792, partial [Trametopsis cervina]
MTSYRRSRQAVFPEFTNSILSHCLEEAFEIGGGVVRRALRLSTQSLKAQRL